VVVLVHGFCQSSAYWTPTAERVAAAGVGAVAVDLPGFGASANEPGPYTMAGLADALATQLDAWNKPRIVLAGGSMGGVVAQHFVLRHPHRVERLLIVATGAYTANEAVALEKADALAKAPWNEQTVTPVVDGFFHRRPPEPEVAKYRQIALSASQPAAVDAARSNGVNRTLAELDAIRVPTLIVQGRHDRARTPEHGAEMRDRIAGSRLVVLEDCGHTPQLEHPDAFHEAALPFLLGRV
jgi:pimeloyl-ACP methyl ester carboxylesterase